MLGTRASLAFPTTIRIVGRAANQENADICGEYVQKGMMHGRPVYGQEGNATVIRYLPTRRRWLIDRSGSHDGEVCVAFAADTKQFAHPGHTELIWSVFSAFTQTFEVDAQVISVAAPRSVTFLGRQQGRESEQVNGSYELFGVCHGRPSYLHSSGDFMIKYQKEGQYWMITAPNEAYGTCFAFAQDDGLNEHPGNADLMWSFFEPQMGAFLLDSAARMLIAPAKLTVMGRCSQMENDRVNGCYYLAGVIESKPVYVKPGTHHLIRFSARNGQNKWLIDVQGLAEPSVLSRLYYWILRGDPGAATESCAAFALAGDTDHPGYAVLEWQVWESSRRAFVLDPSVRTTIAPVSLQVCGRAEGRENSIINGEYVLVGSHNGRPAYMKRGSQIALRFWPPRSRWIIDNEGLRNTDACTAYLPCSLHSEHPGDACSVWHVYETARGDHLQDPSVFVATSTREGAIDEASAGIDAEQQLVQQQQQQLLQQQLEQAYLKEAMTMDPNGSSVRSQYGFYGA